MHSTGLRPRIVSSSIAALTACAWLGGFSLQAASLAWDGGGGADQEFTTTLNWSPNALPGNGDTLTMENGDTALYSTLSGSTTVDRTSIRGGSTLNITGGTLNNSLTGNSTVNDVGRGSLATINQSGGSHSIGHRLRIGSASGGNGTYNLTNGTLTVSRGGNSDVSAYSASIDLGTGGGTGVLKISGGSLTTRVGVGIGAGGTFHVQGGSSGVIGIGSHGSVDGFWEQEAGGTLKVGIDLDGLTKIHVSYVDGTGNDGNVVFEDGAILDVGFLDGLDAMGSWDVMSWEGMLTDGGLEFASGVDTSKWSFAFIDTDTSGTVDTLRVTSVTGSSQLGFPLSLNETNALSWPSRAGKLYEIYECTNLAPGSWSLLETVAATPPTNVRGLDSTEHAAAFYRAVERPDYLPMVRTGVISKLDGFVGNNYLMDQNTTVGDIRHGQFHNSDNMRMAECTPVLVWCYMQPDSLHYQNTNALNAAIWSIDYMCRAQGINGGFNEYHGWCGVPNRTNGKSSVVGFTLHGIGNAITLMAGLPEMQPRLLEYMDPNGTGTNDTQRLQAWTNLLAQAMPFQFSGSGRGHAPNQDACALMGVYAVNEAYAALTGGSQLKTQAEIDVLANEMYYGYPSAAASRPNGQWYSTNGVLAEAGHDWFGYDGNYGVQVSVRYLGVLAPLDSTSATFLSSLYAESLQYFFTPDDFAGLGVYAENGISRRSTGNPMEPNMSSIGVARGYHPALDRLYDIMLPKFAAAPESFMVFGSPHHLQIGVWGYCEWLDGLGDITHTTHRLPTERNEAWEFRDEMMKILVTKPEGGVPTYYTEIWDAPDKGRRHVYGQPAETIDSLNEFP